MGLYLHYQYLLGNIPKRRQNPRRNSFALKADLIKLDMISVETKLLFKNKIETQEHLTSFITGKQAEIERFTNTREVFRSDLKKQKDPVKKETIKADIAGITIKLKELRREVKLAEDVALRSGMIRENIKSIKDNKVLSKHVKEAEKDELLRGSR